MPNKPAVRATEVVSAETAGSLLRELVAHLRQNRTQLREEWASRITEAQLLTAMSKEEIFAEATSVYDNYVEALETETFESLQAYARNLSKRMKLWESCCCCATCWRARCSESIAPTTTSWRASSMRTSRPPTASRSPWRWASSRNASASSASSKRRFVNYRRPCCRCANAC